MDSNLSDIAVITLRVMIDWHSRAGSAIKQRVGWPGRPGRAAGLRKPRHVDAISPSISRCTARELLSGASRFFNADGAASCPDGVGTRPVLCTRPGHPPVSVGGLKRATAN
jgi:hypothetical protein